MSFKFWSIGKDAGRKPKFLDFKRRSKISLIEENSKQWTSNLKIKEVLHGTHVLNFKMIVKSGFDDCDGRKIIAYNQNVITIHYNHSKRGFNSPRKEWIISCKLNKIIKQQNRWELQVLIPWGLLKTIKTSYSKYPREKHYWH